MPHRAASRPAASDSCWIGDGIIDVVHLVARGTFAPGSVRCTIGNVAREEPYRIDRFDGDHYIRCYVDLQVREYILGTGPSTLSVEVFHHIYNPEDFIASYSEVVDDPHPPGWKPSSGTAGAQRPLRRGRRVSTPGRRSIFSRPAMTST